MKKLLFLFAAILMAANVMAEGHMKFKGIEIDGTPKEFIKQLEAKGFKYSGFYNGVDVLTGDFAGYKNCNVAVIATNNVVVRITVFFPESDTWEALYKNYSILKELLTTKYGSPVTDKEEWQNSYGQRDDNSKMHELKMNRAHILSQFDTSEGSVRLEIAHLDFDCYVVLSYFDNQSQDQLRNSALEDL